ncbi:hypothetical protein vBPaerPsIn_135c [Pseudomonas phage vB_Paer_PsIn]|uniref:Uncharacterized protein n=1 Tax=Pseudomonas phage vB_Paer_PsIn TaxID=2924907 RepID=A0AAE9GV64_9CAUD|nr:hypothetical protein QE348_gp135 [Pseudomonas phage vB_Paer_PsIn]UOL48163.1 hypothetical protein vBPaerPsIn_135c [Pseudomonas phage vB_Paer_PsIn]
MMNCTQLSLQNESECKLSLNITMTMVARKGVIPKIYSKQPTSYANRICL